MDDESAVSRDRSTPRRRFLRRSAAGLGALALARAARVGAAPLEFAPAAFGAAGATLIWAGATGARTVRVEYGTDATLARRSAGPTVDLAAGAGYTATARLAGLAAGETYHYRLADAGGGEPLSSIGRFKTAPAGPRTFTFAFSGDMHEGYRPFQLFDVIGARDPDFFLHLGDTVYADQPRKQFVPSLAHYRRKHATIRRDDPLQRFLARHTTFAIWDDHEIEDGAHGGHPDMAVALQAFREYWPCEGAVAGELYRRFTWAGTDFFILDVRRYRSPQQEADGPGKTLLGEAQKAWFLEGLKASTAAFKFVLTPVPFHGGSADAWGNYRTERDEIVRFLKAHGISGIVFLTADYHLARDWTSRTTGLREYMAGPIAQFTHYQKHPAARERYARSGSFHYGDGCNFGLFRVDPAAGRSTVEFVDARGTSLHTAEFAP